MKNVALAAGTLLFIVLIERFGPPALARISILLGIVLGTIVAIPLGMTQLGQVAEADGSASPRRSTSASRRSRSRRSSRCASSRW